MNTSTIPRPADKGVRVKGVLIRVVYYRQYIKQCQKAQLGIVTHKQIKSF